MTDDLETEGAFWEAAGYETLGKYTEPMPLGIWCDEMYLIGIHQYGMIEPFSITHFDPNMKDVNSNLVEEGFELEPFMDSPDDSDLTHATLMTPYGIKFYLFTATSPRRSHSVRISDLCPLTPSRVSAIDCRLLASATKHLLLRLRRAVTKFHKCR